MNANKDLAIKWFAAWAAAKIIALGAQAKILIPIPCSKTIVASPEDFRTFKIAQELAARVPNATATSVLRFVEPRPSSREEGGSRDPNILYANLTLTRAIPAGQVVLIDDIMTSGGHFIAASGNRTITALPLTSRWPAAVRWMLRSTTVCGGS
ncbi:putative amidophosphoribosyltransferase [Bradyrhizobium sp. F1.13.1]